jgi:aspartate/methionine/tyrosine aminotransferase
MLSRRSGFALEENRLARAVAERRAAGAEVVDLAESNPTRAGFAYPVAALAEAMWDARSLRYQPVPGGLWTAREAVAASYGARAPDPVRVVLTASTSDAYGMLFKLLCDPGDRVLVPRPSYPLFDYLATLEGVVAAPYELGYDGAWHIDLASVRSGAPGARAIVLVNPNNPTGSYVAEEERRALVALGLPLISDEVFADYPLAPPRAPRADFIAAHDDVLAFSLGGLSKAAGLPQLKLGWIVCAGPAAARTAALARLELIADTYLAVATPVQHAAPRLLALAPGIRSAIAARTRDNRDALRAALAARPDSPLTLLAAEAGWYAIVRVPATRSEEAWVLALLDDGVLVHPGYFFDFTEGAHLVVSCLPEPAGFRAGIDRLLARVV